ncbi:hypothetical protein [Boseongicola aestuarii]|uniref:Uncharacterized protein n=1 Tax=Boseongicola aestuarii TaxID=1470561 RepID=A0A238IVT8_9RHOB|nr:hypothetical protein [Boseongicola aestuarii]SMX22517.1 hypothetical protein BOA8489_00614 [Boseongicola aestuarii]
MHNLGIAGLTSAAIGIWTLAAAVSYAPIGNTEERTNRQQIIAPDANLLSAYEDCSHAAEVRLLSLEEATRCSETFLLLKLSLLPEVDIAEFKSLPPQERWEIQRRGYAALVAWRQKRISL